MPIHSQGEIRKTKNSGMAWQRALRRRPGGTGGTGGWWGGPIRARAPKRARAAAAAATVVGIIQRRGGHGGEGRGARKGGETCYVDVGVACVLDHVLSLLLSV